MWHMLSGLLFVQVSKQHKQPPPPPATTTSGGGGRRWDSRVDSGSLDLETPQSETASAASPRSPLDALDEALGRVVASTAAVASR